jgi:hypothetical protein
MDPSNSYFGWLVSLIDDGRADQHPIIIHAAWDMEFTYSIPTDANRAQDGIDLRRAYERESSLALPDLGPCRVLEFLIALSQRMEYILYDYDHPNQCHVWFWKMITNLGVIGLNDRKIVDSLLHRFIIREYGYYGDGGLFPLSHPKEDQRTVEVWYQMHKWIAEAQNRVI